MIKNWLAILFLMFLVETGSSFKIQNNINKKEAIHLAEQFIIDNGYTTLPANKSNISYELFDRYESNLDSLLHNRYNSFHPESFCISEDVDRWEIGFLSSGVDLDKPDSLERLSDLPGQAVIVMKNGNEIRMAHKQPAFSKFKKL